MRFPLRLQKNIVLSVLAVLCLIIVGELLRLYRKPLPAPVLGSYNNLTTGGNPAVAWSADWAPGDVAAGPARTSATKNATTMPNRV